jgi:hypothetical protein
VSSLPSAALSIRPPPLDPTNDPPPCDLSRATDPSAREKPPAAHPSPASLAANLARCALPGNAASSVGLDQPTALGLPTHSRPGASSRQSARGSPSSSPFVHPFGCARQYKILTAF